jgi:cyclophilin family peptidyl-prolyl cis-trans isomerase
MSPRWGVSQHGNYTSWTKLGRMKLGNILQVIIVLAVTILVWESHNKALFAAKQLTRFKEEESLLLLHLQKIEQQSIQLHENLSRLAKVGIGGRFTTDGPNGDASGKVDFDLIHKQTQQLYQMEEELNHEVKTLQTRIQQSARNHIIQEFGEGPVQVILELDFGNNEKALPNKISILLWHDTPHAAWTVLEQIRRNVWDGAEFHWTQGHIIDALPHVPDPMGSKIEFLELSHHGHEAWTVGVRESDSGAMGMYINLQDNTNLHKHETCLGKVIDGFDALQRLLEVLRAQREEKSNSVLVRKVSAMHVTKKDGI